MSEQQSTSQSQGKKQQRKRTSGNEEIIRPKLHRANIVTLGQILDDEIQLLHTTSGAATSSAAAAMPANSASAAAAMPANSVSAAAAMPANSVSAAAAMPANSQQMGTGALTIQQQQQQRNPAAGQQQLVAEALTIQQQQQRNPAAGQQQLGTDASIIQQQQHNPAAGQQQLGTAALTIQQQQQPNPAANQGDALAILQPNQAAGQQQLGTDVLTIQQQQQPNQAQIQGGGAVPNQLDGGAAGGIVVARPVILNSSAALGQFIVNFGGPSGTVPPNQNDGAELQAVQARIQQNKLAQQQRFEPAGIQFIPTFGDNGLTNIDFLYAGWVNGMRIGFLRGIILNFATADTLQGTPIVNLDIGFAQPGIFLNIYGWVGSSLYRDNNIEAGQCIELFNLLIKEQTNRDAGRQRGSFGFTCFYNSNSRHSIVPIPQPQLAIAPPPDQQQQNVVQIVEEPPIRQQPANQVDAEQQQHVPQQQQQAIINFIAPDVAQPVDNQANNGDDDDDDDEDAQQQANDEQPLGPRGAAIQAGVQISHYVDDMNRYAAHQRRIRQRENRERRRQALRALQEQQLMDHIRQNNTAHPRLHPPIRQRAPAMPPNPQIQMARIAQQQANALPPQPPQQQQPNPLPPQPPQQQQPNPLPPQPPQQQQPQQAPLPIGPLTDQEFDQMMRQNGIVIDASRRRDFMCHICFGRFRHYVAYNNCIHGACVLCFAANSAQRRICQDCRAEVYIDLVDRRNPEPRPHLHYQFIVPLAPGEVEEEDDE